MTGLKHDNGKPRLSLVLRHIGALTAAARVLEWGAAKYGSEDNWRLVPDARARYREALGRHVVAWMAGEESDPDTGLPTLAHVLCNALFLMGLGEAAPQEQQAPVAASAIAGDIETREFTIIVRDEGSLEDVVALESVVAKKVRDAEAQRLTVFCDACARLYGLKTPEQKMSDLSAEVEMLTAELDRARARLAELEAAAGWQPMETAPRDGTWVLVAYADKLFGGCEVAAWVDGRWRGRFSYRDADLLGWMPLPTPPAVGGER